MPDTAPPPTSQPPPGGTGRRWCRYGPALASAGICLLVAMACLLLEDGGHFRPVELQAYDRLVRHQRGRIAATVPVLVIRLDEQDIQAQNQYPVSDAALAGLLQTLFAHHPRVVGVDIYRDIQVPQLGVAGDDGPSRLNDVIARHPNLIWGIKVTGTPVRPPAILRPLVDKYPIPPRVGFTDVDLDPDGVVRRMTLRIRQEPASAPSAPSSAAPVTSNTPASSKTYLSMDLQVAAAYLARENPPIKISPAAEPLLLGAAPLPRLRRGDGAYSAFDFQGYQRMLDFRGPENFRTISFREATDAAHPLTDADVKDAVVLVGVNAESVRDALPTPLGGSEAGVTIHARAVDQLVRLARGGRPLSAWGPSPRRAWVVLWAAVGGAAGFFLRSPPKFIAGLVAGLAVVALVAWLEMLRDTWIPVFPPAAGWVASAVTVSSYMFHRERMDRAALMTLFGRHVDPRVARAIWDRRDEFFAGGYMVPRARRRRSCSPTWRTSPPSPSGWTRGNWSAG